MNKINYIFHFDELSWNAELLNRPFNEIKIPYMKRPIFIDWINNNIQTKVYIWPGVLTPKKYEMDWGHLISPDEETTFLIFTNDGDQTRYSLEFVGSDNNIHIKTYKNGLDAYYSRKR